MIDRKKLEAKGYKFNDRTMDTLAKRFSEDYKRIDFVLKGKDIAYTGAEHTGKPKLPNITILPNLFTVGEGIVAGQNMGHKHTRYELGDRRRFQEVYELHSMGAMILRDENSIRMHLLEKGDKVIVGTNEYMTMINLSVNPLETLDYANPTMNDASMDLEYDLGSIMLVRFTEEGLSFKLNPQYVRGGILKDSCEIKIKVEEADDVLNSILASKHAFKECGIDVILGSNIPKDLEAEFSRPLEDLAADKKSKLVKILDVERW